MKALAMLTMLLGFSITTVLAQNLPSTNSAPSVPTSPPASPAPPGLSPEFAPEKRADILNELSDVPVDKVERYVTFQTRTLNRMFGVNLRYDGILPQIKRADHPLQLLNPFAPARYGDAFDNVTVNPLNGRAEGFNVFAIRF
jgi:hypothetical protein